MAKIRYSDGVKRQSDHNGKRHRQNLEKFMHRLPMLTPSNTVEHATLSNTEKCSNMYMMFLPKRAYERLSVQHVLG